MTDISKCNGHNCPVKEKCYRYTASKGMYQSYVCSPYEINDGVFSCDLYWGANAESVWNQLKDITNGNIV